MEKIIEIPEGYEAQVEGNKVILKPKESEDERIRSLLVWQVHRNIEDETNDLAKSVYDGIKGHDPDLEESIEDWKKCLAYLERQKEQHFTKRNALFNKCVEKCDTAVMKEVSDSIDKMPGKEQRPAEDGFTNNESEYDKGYREGHRFGLKQTEEYMLPGGKTFKGLIPCWINAPSELQPAHKYHGKNVVVMHENNGGFRCTCIDDEKATTFHLPEDTLFVEGWRNRPAGWSEEDERMLGKCIDAASGYYDTKDKQMMKDFLKSLPERFTLHPSWKPSEEQMEALMLAIEGKWGAILPTGYMSRRLEDLYEGLANTFKVECKL